MNAIETIGLTKQFGSHTALDALTVSIPKGVICGFLGKNGAGKTTTIKMLAGLTKPTAGTISLMEKHYEYGSKNHSVIGYLPDVPNFYGYMSAAEYLTFSGKLYGIDPQKLKKKVEELLELVGLHAVSKRIAAFSRGMKQRLGIAQALIHEPEIVLMDEPVSALDPLGRHEIMELIRSLRGQITIFFSTHILADVETTCDYTLILDQGRLLAADTILNLKKAHSANAGMLRFLTPDDCGKFLSFAGKQPDLELERRNALELVLRGNDLGELGRLIPWMLAETHTAMEHYQSYIPTLEDIFMEVTAHE